MPKQIVDATLLLERLARDVPEKLGFEARPHHVGQRDVGFRPGMIPRMRAAFSDVVVLELPRAKHYIHEDARQ